MATATPSPLRLIPHLIVRGAPAAIDFYKRAFDAIELSRIPAPDGSIAHAVIRIGDAQLFLADEGAVGPTRSPASLGAATSSIMLYVADADAVYARALAAGAEPLVPLADMIWGDRWGMVRDPFGHVWQIATHVEDVSPAEMERRMRALGGPA